MHSALRLFNSNIDNARNTGGIYEYLTQTHKAPVSYEELLRSQLVNAVSAFDKLIHDLVRAGMVEIFIGKRPPTPKYLSEPISIQIHVDISNASIPPKEHIFEQAIIKKLKIISFQDPLKVAEGLSYIWAESQKWQKISSEMQMSDDIVKKTLKLIVDRRNAIVHEADINPATNQKFEITKAECDQVTDFLHVCGTKIAALVSI